jgi:hypothetical protein
LARDQISKAVVLVGACRAAVQVRAHPGYALLRILARELVLYVDVEVLEALLAGELRSRRTQQACQHLPGSAL